VRSIRDSRVELMQRG